MGKHDEYGKRILRETFPSEFLDWGKSIEIDLGTENPARIDGTIGSDICVEIESRVAKQIRGALLDLILHNYPKKCLIIEPVHSYNPQETATQCEKIFNKFLDPKDFRVVLLCGTGNDNSYIEEDKLRIISAISDLRKF